MTTEPQNTPLAETKHTELPWVLRRFPYRQNSLYLMDAIPDSTTGECVANIICSPNTNPNYEANLRFIANACNSYDALVAALKVARNSIYQIVRENTRGMSDFDPADHHTIKQIDAALAKANGGAL